MDISLSFAGAKLLNGDDITVAVSEDEIKYIDTSSGAVSRSVLVKDVTYTCVSKEASGEGELQCQYC